MKYLWLIFTVFLFVAPAQAQESDASSLSDADINELLETLEDPKAGRTLLIT